MAQRVFVIDDVFEEFVPCDLAVVAESIDQADGLAVLCHSDDGVGDVLDLVGLEVEGQVQPQIPRFVPEDAHAHLVFDDLDGGLVQFEELHAERTSAEAARPQLHSEHVS